MDRRRNPKYPKTLIVVTATELQNKIILAVQQAYPGARLWRNNVGLAYPVTSFKRANGNPALMRPVRYGVVGSGDIAGWLYLDGRAIVAHIEVKVGKDKQSDEQRIFMETVRKYGGIYVVARSVDQALEELAKITGRAPF